MKTSEEIADKYWEDIVKQLRCQDGRKAHRLVMMAIEEALALNTPRVIDEQELQKAATEYTGAWEKEQKAGFANRQTLWMNLDFVEGARWAARENLIGRLPKPISMEQYEYGFYLNHDRKPTSDEWRQWLCDYIQGSGNKTEGV